MLKICVYSWTNMTLFWPLGTIIYLKNETPNSFSTVHFNTFIIIHIVVIDPCMKKKRTKRPRVETPPSEEEYLALCLIMLARGTTDTATTTTAAAAKPVEMKSNQTSSGSIKKRLDMWGPLEL